jgi:hypothetical protein
MRRGQNSPVDKSSKRPGWEAWNRRKGFKAMLLIVWNKDPLLGRFAFFEMPVEAWHGTLLQAASTPELQAALTAACFNIR